MKIRTIQRRFGTPVQPNPYWDEHVLYLQNGERRLEEFRKNVERLWPNGPWVTFYQPRTALIESCDGERKKSFALDLGAKTFAPTNMGQRLTPEQRKVLDDRRQQHRLEGTPNPTVRHRIVTTDTGERKQTFGYEARHVITTHTVTPAPGAENITGSESITDGWYIDLDTTLPCDLQHDWAQPKEGTTYSSARLSTQTKGPDGTVIASSSSPANLVEMTYVGKPETGLGVQVKMTRKGRHPYPFATSELREYLTTNESEVLELSNEPLDPALFEIPSDFRRIERVLPCMRLPLWAQWLSWTHRKWTGLFR